MSDLKKSGQFNISDEKLNEAKASFTPMRVDERHTRDTIAEIFRGGGNLIDPHTAVGVYAARMKNEDIKIPMVSLSTAHPAKFPEAVKDVTGIHPELPQHMADLFEREEKFDVLPNDMEILKTYIRKHK